MAIARQASAGDDAMQMRMMKQVLAPGVQHGEEADLGAQVLGVGSDGAQGLAGGTEEQAVDEQTLAPNAASAASLCAQHVQPLGGESPLANLMEVKA